MATLTGQFRTKHNDQYTITITSDLLLSDGTLTLGKDPLHYVMPESQDKYPGVRTIEAEIVILTQGNLSVLYSDDPLKVKVSIKKNGSLQFFGYLEPSEWQQPLVPGEWNEVQIVAMDPLAALKNVRETRRMLMLGQGSDTYGTPSLITRMGEILGESLTYRDHTNQSVMTAYFSTEAFIGTDLEDKEAYTTYGDMLQGFCRAAGVTMMMTDKTINVYKVDDQPTGSQGDLMQWLASNNLDMMVVPPVRRVTGSWDKMPDFEQPKFTNSFAYPFTYNTDKVLFCLMGGGTWEPFDRPDGWSSVNASLFCTATDSNSYGNPFVGVGALQKKEACHIFVPYTGRTLNVEAELHFNDWRGASELAKSQMAMYPDDAVCNTWVEQLNNAQTINLWIGEHIKPDTVNNTFGLDSSLTTNERYDIIKGSRWGKCQYTFSLDDDKVLRCQGYVQLQLKSYAPAAGYGSKAYAPRFARNIKITEGWTDDKTITVDASGLVSLDDMDFDTPLILGENYLLGSVGSPVISGKQYTQTRNVMKIVAAQYSNAHVKWTGDFRSYNVLSNRLIPLMQHVVLQGKKHTIVGCDWNVRDGEVELILLEDYKQ